MIISPRKGKVIRFMSLADFKGYELGISLNCLFFIESGKIDKVHL